MTNIHPDVSEHQPSAVNDTFNRQFLAFRASSEYDRPDALAPANLAWCLKARAAGKIVNFCVYVIPGNVPNDAVTGRLDALGVPNDCVIMLDVESWGGLITGDHSQQFNTLATTLRQRQGGRADLVWGYLNPNVDASLWPSRPAWLGFIQPAYGPSTAPDPRGLNRIGWQYTNGSQNGTSYPSSSSPFGAVDHNVMFIDYPKAEATLTPLQAQQLTDLHNWLSGGTAPGQANEGGTIATDLETDQGLVNQANLAAANLQALKDAVAAVKAELDAVKADTDDALAILKGAPVPVPPPPPPAGPVTGTVSGNITITPAA